MRLAAEVVEDLAEVRRLLRERITGDHALLVDVEVPGVHRAATLLSSAHLGSYRFSDLAPLAVGVELLSLALEWHYGGPREAPAAARTILGGDRFYGTGLAEICSAGDPGLVEIVARALADIAQSQAQLEAAEERVTARRSRVLQAAAELGVSAAGVGEPQFSRLLEDAAHLGRFTAGDEFSVGESRVSGDNGGGESPLPRELFVRLDESIWLGWSPRG